MKLLETLRWIKGDHDLVHRRHDPMPDCEESLTAAIITVENLEALANELDARYPFGLPQHAAARLIADDLHALLNGDAS